jgi:hypothetical protein
MYIKNLIERYRNDFSFVCGCEHCGHTFKRGDGYADTYFCQVVVPNQHCPECGKNTYGESDAASVDTDPEGQDAKQGLVGEADGGAVHAVETPNA